MTPGKVLGVTLASEGVPLQVSRPFSVGSLMGMVPVKLGLICWAEAERRWRSLVKSNSGQGGRQGQDDLGALFPPKTLACDLLRAVSVGTLITVGGALFRRARSGLRWVPEGHVLLGHSGCTPMFDFLRKLFFTSDFMPHGHCYFWRPEILWLHVVSDALIALAYFSIPVALFYFTRKRRSLAFDWIFLMFGVFICACGTTHLLEIVTVWQPMYRLAAGAEGDGERRVGERPRRGAQGAGQPTQPAFDGHDEGLGQPAHAGGG